MLTQAFHHTVLWKIIGDLIETELLSFIAKITSKNVWNLSDSQQTLFPRTYLTQPFLNPNQNTWVWKCINPLSIKITKPTNKFKNELKNTWLSDPPPLYQINGYESFQRTNWKVQRHEMANGPYAIGGPHWQLRQASCVFAAVRSGQCSNFV